MSEVSADALDRVLTMEVVRVTEHAAVAAARFRGRGHELRADQAAVAAMRRELDRLPIEGTVVIGDDEHDEGSALIIGEVVGAGGPKIDVALDSLEGTTVCAKDLPNSMSVIAMAERGSLLKAPHVYMEKIAVGPGYSDGIVDLDRPIGDVINDLAREKGVEPRDITTCVMDRPRHTALIDSIRKTGASIRLIGDCDVAAVIDTTDPEGSGIDLYAGIGGASEGVLAAAALRCTGGQMRGRLVFRNDEERGRAKDAGIVDLDRSYDLDEMASGDVIFAATGVTSGTLLSGIRFDGAKIFSETLVMRSASQTIRRIRGEHHANAEKFDQPNTNASR